ncbi:magnesium transporter [Oerskovia sp. M15]
MRRGTTVADTLDALRRVGDDVETIYTVPVLGPGRVVEGVVSLRRLLVSDPGTPVEDVMSSAVTVEATDDQEHAANVVRDGGYVAVPVVDHEQRLLGVLTVDDAMRILEAEDDEDSARVGGSEPLRRPYLSVSVLGLVRSRVVWLLLLIVAASLTVGVQSYFEAELDTVVALALFIPLLIGTGGNAGSQAATTVVGRWLWATSAAGTCCASWAARCSRDCCSVPCSPRSGSARDVGRRRVHRAGARDHGRGVCVLATTVGSSIPILARRVGIDPAIVAAPFISTFVDTLGLIIYFSVAKAVLGI